MRYRFTLLAVWLAGALLAWAAIDPMTKISVQVTATDGKPIDGAQVVARLTKSHSGKVHKNTRTAWVLATASDGLAAGPELPQGTVVVQVSARGYEDFIQTYDVEEPAKTIQVKLTPGLPTTDLHIRVVNAEGYGVEDASVLVKVVQATSEVKTGDLIRKEWELRTNDQGVATVAGSQRDSVVIPQGSVLIRVNDRGYRPFEQTYVADRPEMTITPNMVTDVTTTKLTVQVTTMGGKPLESADVVIRFVSGRSVIKLGRKIRTTWEMRTNEEGIAKVPDIPQGTVRIQVIARGYQTFGQTYDVDTAEKTVLVKMNPPQEQYTAH